MNIVNRDKLNVLQTMYGVIKDAHEYAHYDCAEDIRNYYYFIYGVLAMTETMLNEINEDSYSYTKILNSLTDNTDTDKAMETINNAYKDFANGKLD